MNWKKIAHDLKSRYNIEVFPCEFLNVQVELKILHGEIAGSRRSSKWASSLKGQAGAAWSGRKDCSAICPLWVSVSPQAKPLPPVIAMQTHTIDLGTAIASRNVERRSTKCLYFDEFCFLSTSLNEAMRWRPPFMRWRYAIGRI